LAVRPRTPGWSAARGSSLSGIEASEHACPVRPGTPGTGALCRRRSSTSRPRTGTRRSNRCRCRWRSFRPPHANGCTPRPHQRLRKSLPAARPGERRVPPHAAQEVAQAAREAAGVGPVAQQVAPVAREVSPAAPRRRFASLGSVVGSKSPPDPPGVLPGGYSGSVAWEEAPRTQTIRPQRAPPHRRQRPEPWHRPPHGSGGARLNVVPPGNQSMTSYSSGCIHFLSCFVSCTAHGQSPTHFFGWRGGLRTAKSEGVERRRRAHRLTADGLWDGRLPGATRSSATRSEEQAKEQLPAGASRARRDVADVTGDVGSRSLVLATLKRRTTRGSTTAARAAVVTYEEPDAIRPRRCGGALVLDAGGR